MAQNQDKFTYLMNAYQRDWDPDDPMAFNLAICYVKLGEYDEALRLFHISLDNLFKPPYAWKTWPSWLVDVCVLSGREDRYKDVLNELELIKPIPSKGDSPLACYAYGLMELLSPSGWDISLSIQGLMKRPKQWKDTYAMGHVIQSIVNRDQIGLENSLVQLLKAHEGMAKYGELRETAEGFLCMPAMSLTYAAREQGLEIHIENEYLVMGYLDYLSELSGNNKEG